MAAEPTEMPSALTYEGMNAQVGSFGGGYRAAKRDGWSVTRIGGLAIRVLAVLMLAAVVVAIARAVIESS